MIVFKLMLYLQALVFIGGIGSFHSFDVSEKNKWEATPIGADKYKE